MSLNVLGSVDILPFTGITFPFVSRGGSSLIASWGLLAFIKAADTRQNASFVVKTPKPVRSRSRMVAPYEKS
jgi:cell division protein FtsW (lipid II flippase)